MLKPLTDGVDVKPLITVGERVGSYRFESLPDGIAIAPGGGTKLDIYVNHETSKVPFPFNAATGVGLTDFDNAQLSHLVLKHGAGKILSGGRQPHPLTSRSRPFRCSSSQWSWQSC